jgi:CheY-like chemotaxis protein
MPNGGRLTIESANADSNRFAQLREVAPGEYVCLSVTDTGAGMTDAVRARAFDPFFTTKPIGHGTGLGLSMVYGFARQSEGHARIDSEVGRGTTVKLYLPRFRGIVADAPDAAGATRAHLAERGETVLVIEDEVSVRELVIEVLNDLGYRALQAADGPAGLQLLRASERIDLLVTDVGLPGMNGRQVAEAARELRADLKVLFITGYAENAALANVFLAPGMEMMTKPFAVEALAERIRDMISASVR